MIEEEGEVIEEEEWSSEIRTLPDMWHSVEP